MAARPASLDKYLNLRELAEAGKYEEAWRRIAQLLIDDPNDVRALIVGSYVMLKMGGLPQAYHFALTATRLWPKDSAAWTNLGHAASQMWLIDEAERCYRKALDCCEKEAHRKILWVNLSALYIDNGRFKEAEVLTRKILAVDPEHHNAQANLGFCQLATGNWAEGWKGYHKTIGSDWRPKVQYADEPEWDGTPGKIVALYSDQGLGDEISFASMVPDAIDISRKVILDCDDRLKGLLQRSFPQARVYGTRRAKGGTWKKEDWEIDASLPLGQIGEFFRTSLESFPGTPYLKPCPSRVQMWKALFAQKRKPCIGIAWTGGIPKTNSRNRKLTLEALLPLLSLDAHFVSLQYKDAEAEIVKFKESHDVDLAQYSWGTLTDDYDDTAALVASLDYVVCIQTAVAHTAGALGTPVVALIPTATQWRYGHGDSIPWYKCLKVIRQTSSDWSHEIERAITVLSTHFPGLSRGAGKAPPGGALRDSIHSLCADGQRHHQPNGDHAPP